MTTFKIPEPEFKDLGYAYTACVSGALFSKKQLKQAMRDALEQAAQLMEEQDTQAPKHNAKAIRAMKEQIK